MSDIIPTQDEFKTLQLIATHAGSSKFFNNLGGVDGILCISLMARELGISPMAALSGGINYILGKVEISPRLMNSMIRQRGHTLDITESSDTSCTIKGTRKDTKETYVCTFTIEMAKKAGLVKSGGGWEKYPSDMLFARCLSRLARRLFADVIGPAYVEGEIADSKDEMKMAVNESEVKEESKKPESDPKISVDQLEYLRTLINEDIEFKIKERYEIVDLSDLTTKQAKICIDLAKKKMESVTVEVENG